VDFHAGCLRIVYTENVPLLDYRRSAINLHYRPDKHNHFDEPPRAPQNPSNLAEQRSGGLLAISAALPTDWVAGNFLFARDLPAEFPKSIF
jgi:hypothetical protein